MFPKPINLSDLSARVLYLEQIVAKLSHKPTILIIRPIESPAPASTKTANLGYNHRMTYGE